MAYTTIDDPTKNFNTKLYTGTGSAQSITGVGFSPEMSWFKQRNTTRGHVLEDIVRGAGKTLFPHDSSGETAGGYYLTSFDSDGFTLPSSNVGTNESSGTYVAWNWKAGGTAPAITYTVKVVSDSGNKYRFDDFGTSAVTLDLQEGGTYTFDQSDSSNSGHPLRFSTTSNGTHGGGSEYTTGVTTTGTPGSSGAKTVITVAASAPTLYYYCTQHSGMGGQANTNSTFGSSNFSGTLQSTVCANVTAGMSIVSWTGSGNNGHTVGHNLGVKPAWIITKNRDATSQWIVWHQGGTSTKNTDLSTDNIEYDSSASGWQQGINGVPTSSVLTFTAGSHGNNNVIDSSEKYISYVFVEKQGYSKFGAYTGNGNADGTFVYTGFRPAWVMIKDITTGGTGHGWIIFDNKRNTFNPTQALLLADATDTEYTITDPIDFLSNGFKIRDTNQSRNDNGSTYIFMAFAESPFVNSNGVPNNAR